ncbi:MAG: hypothetical protein EA398_12735 [Deltaproteobacteria bacterium]|nr:MAG: hypothetical protein EA398_12735 [Deltaproteobacteria bacterium]
MTRPDASRFGQRLFQEGRALVLQGHVRLTTLVWDADEVLWDWLMVGSELARGLGRLVRTRDLGHREYLRIRPGILELILGMQDASRTLGLDPWMRLWTDGYPWRLWRIADELPILAHLLGPGPPGWPDTPESFALHPRIFTRTDYAAAVVPMADPALRAERLALLPAPVARVIGNSLRTRPEDSSLKIPELARWAGKDGFEEALVLIDDNLRNTSRFVRAGRRAVHVRTEAPRLLGRVPNTVWRDPRTALARLSAGHALAIADALRRHGDRDPGHHLSVAHPEPVTLYPHTDLELDVPDARIRAQWVDPRARVRAAFAASAGSADPAGRGSPSGRLPRDWWGLRSR